MTLGDFSLTSALMLSRSCALRCCTCQHPRDPSGRVNTTCGARMELLTKMTRWRKDGKRDCYGVDTNSNVHLVLVPHPRGDQHPGVTRLSKTGLSDGLETFSTRMRVVEHLSACNANAKMASIDYAQDPGLFFKKKLHLDMTMVAW